MSNSSTENLCTKYRSGVDSIKLLNTYVLVSNAQGKPDNGDGALPGPDSVLHETGVEPAHASLIQHHSTETIDTYKYRPTQSSRKCDAPCVNAY